MTTTKTEALLREALGRVRDRFFPSNQPERDRDLLWQLVNDALATHPAPTQPEQANGGEPLFWYRPCSNGLYYEGPLHNKSIEDVRKRSGAWVPLYPHHPAQAASAEREARVIEQNARKAAQEQLYTERERHTAEVKRLQAEIGRLKAPAASVSDAVSTVRERYRATKWGKAAECICDAVDEAILALRPVQVPMTDERSVSVKVDRELFSFHSEQDWVNKARSRYANCGVQKGHYITVDAAGHVMHMGLCFKHAAYPVTVYQLQTNWPKEQA